MGSYFKVFYDIKITKNDLNEDPEYNINKDNLSYLQLKFSKDPTLELYVLTAQRQLNLWIKHKKKAKRLFQITSTQYVQSNGFETNKIMIYYVQMDKWWEFFTL